MNDPRPVTVLLEEMRAGRSAAADELFTVVLDELRSLAHRALRRERVGHTLQTTALVSEAYLKLLGGVSPDFQSRAQFLGTAARAMRQVLIDHARHRGARKRDPGGPRVELEAGELSFSDDQLATALQVDEALAKFEAVDERACRVVELRFFAGLEFTEIAEILTVTERTIRRDWQFAKAWLYDAMA